ncbi:Gag-Pol polyprotein [Gossypium australe]|uniref:Gag-Pol polyprotein n=1 Tax=Gossypium australe TaxID=47621 RepID=A0A5B6WS00_9ROSI|nr:Gag-Pol polyprotein [Gossypium australe]
MDPDRVVADDVESNAPAPAQGAALADSRPILSSHEIRMNKPPVDKIRKHGAEKFKATVDDEVERAEFWLHNTICVFDELSCTLDECIKCVIKFRKKYISQRFIDQKCKEFLELKQGRMTVIVYEREFVRLSRYARECVSTKAIMCKRFEDGLNEDTKLLVKILEIKEFVVLVEQACKAEELEKEKRKADFEARDARKIFPTSVGNVRSNQPEYKYCSKQHPDSCRLNDRACFNCGSLDHFIRECLGLAEQNTVQNVRPSNTTSRGRPPRNMGNVSGSQRGTKDTFVRSKARAPARAYAIRAREEASSPDVITSINLGSTHSYVCETLVSNKTLPVESTKFVIRVSNLLGWCVLVDKMCKNCPLMIQDSCFPIDLMLLPFDEFDIILGMDWLTLHDVIMNCQWKTIDLRCQNDEIIQIEFNDLNGLPTVISSMLA